MRTIHGIATLNLKLVKTCRSTDDQDLGLFSALVCDRVGHSASDIDEVTGLEFFHRVSGTERQPPGQDVETFFKVVGVGRGTTTGGRFPPRDAVVLPGILTPDEELSG